MPATVTTIGQSAFNMCSKLISVTLPDTITSIGPQAFQGCTSLGSDPSIPFSLPSKLTVIEDATFAQCSSLTSITIPDSVVRLKNGAFFQCPKLANVHLGNGLEVIESQVFWVGNQIGAPFASLHIPKSLRSLASDALCVSWQDCGPLQLVWPNGVSWTPKCPFQGMVSIPAGVTIVPDGSFSGCAESGSTHVTSITIPDSVTALGASAFMRTQITELVIPDTVQELGQNLCYQCNQLTSLTVGSGVVEISRFAFQDCRLLRSVTFRPGSLKVIHTAAFNMLTFGGSLRTVTLPDSLTYIGQSAFAGLIQEVHFGSSPSSSNLGGIGDFAFSRCQEPPCTGLPCTSTQLFNNKTIVRNVCMPNVTIPDSVRYLGDQAFEATTTLIWGSSGVKFNPKCPTTSSEVAVPSGVFTIPARAYHKCGTLTSITLPDTVRRINTGAFNACPGLVRAHLGKGLLSVGSMWSDDPRSALPWSQLKLQQHGIGSDCGGSFGAFQYSGLSSVTLPDSLEYIAGCAFRKTRLQSIDLGHGVTLIGQLAFSRLDELSQIEIPSSVKLIDISAFQDCPYLTFAKFQVTSDTQGLSIGEYAFSGSRLKKVTLPPLTSYSSANSFPVNTTVSYAVLPPSPTATPTQAPTAAQGHSQEPSCGFQVGSAFAGAGIGILVGVAAILTATSANKVGDARQNQMMMLEQSLVSDEDKYYSLSSQ